MLELDERHVDCALAVRDHATREVTIRITRRRDAVHGLVHARMNVRHLDMRLEVERHWSAFQTNGDLVHKEVGWPFCSLAPVEMDHPLGHPDKPYGLPVRGLVDEQESVEPVVLLG